MRAFVGEGRDQISFSLQWFCKKGTREIDSGTFLQSSQKSSSKNSQESKGAKGSQVSRMVPSYPCKSFKTKPSKALNKNTRLLAPYSFPCVLGKVSAITGCVRNASEMRQQCATMGLVLLGKEERSKCVKNASKMLWGRRPSGRYRSLLRNNRGPQTTKCDSQLAFVLKKQRSQKQLEECVCVCVKLSSSRFSTT